MIPYGYSCTAKEPKNPIPKIKAPTLAKISAEDGLELLGSDLGAVFGCGVHMLRRCRRPAGLSFAFLPYFTSRNPETP